MMSRRTWGLWRSLPCKREWNSL